MDVHTAQPTLIYISNFEKFSDAYVLCRYGVAAYAKKGWKTNYISETYMELKVKNVILWKKNGWHFKRN